MPCWQSLEYGLEARGRHRFWELLMSSFGDAWNGLGEDRGIEIRILPAAAIASVPACIDGQLHQVRQSSNLLGACRCAARQSAETVEVHSIGTLRSKIGIEKSKVADFVFRVVVNVLIDVLVKVFKCIGVRLTPASARDLFVLDASKFVVLLPQITLNDLGG